MTEEKLLKEYRIIEKIHINSPSLWYIQRKRKWWGWKWKYLYKEDVYSNTVFGSHNELIVHYNKERAILDIKKLIAERIDKYNKSVKYYVVHSVSMFEKMDTKEKFKRNLLKF